MPSFLSNFETQITQTFTNLVDPASQALLSVFKPAFVAGFGIWVLLIAYEVAWGVSEDGLGHAIKKIFRIFMIGTIALFMWPTIREFADATREGFIVALGGIQATPGQPTISTVLETNILTPLTDQFYEVLDSCAKAMSETSISKPITMLWTMLQCILVFCAFAFFALCGGGLCIVTLVMYGVAFSFFQLLMVVGPFFLLCMSFPFLQRFMETWVGAVITAVLAMAFTAFLAVATSSILGLTSPPPGSRLDINDGNVMLTLVGKGGFAMLLIYLYYKVFDLAASLGGGMNLGNNLMGGSRSILNDMRRGGNNSNGNSNGAGNSIRNGTGGGGGNSGRGGAADRAASRNRTLTGAAITGIAGGVRGAAASAGRVGRYAYNRVRTRAPHS